MRNQLVKFKNWIDYKENKYEILEGRITGGTAKFYDILASNGKRYRKKKVGIDYFINKALRKEKLKSGLHVQKWFKKLLFDGKDFGDTIIRYYFHDGDTEIGYYEKKTIFKKKRVYSEDIQHTHMRMDEIREIKITNTITDRGIRYKYFNKEEILLDKLDSILI